MTSPGYPAVRNGRLFALLGLVLVALSMRNAVAVAGPLFQIISGDLQLDVVVLSLIGAAPPIGFALAGLILPAITQRFGLEWTLIAALAVLVVGQAVRALSGDAAVLVGSTLVLMGGIGAINVLLPPLVRRYYPDRVGGFTSLYLVLMGVGASGPAFVAVQIAEATSWRVAIGLWLVIPLLALLPWLANVRAYRGVAPPSVVASGVEPGREARRVMSSPTAWAITATFTLSSISIYAAMAYLPAMLTAVGVIPAVAAATLGIVIVIGIPEALIVPLLATRSRTVLGMIVVAGVCGVAGWAGMLLAPSSAPFLWGVLIGLIPIVFPLALLLVNTRTRDHQVTVSVSGFVQGVGYVAAGLFTLIVGLLHDATGSWAVPIILLLATMVLVVPAVAVLRRDRMVDDEVSQTRARRPR
ncbi:MAG: MFS transporter [Pseudolysinimonas sp.]|uniref:MFS transporter n=1 Tax=Pseudolysinimonas sp. TaxID=2680009 RepID=UPI003C73CCC0